MSIGGVGSSTSQMIQTLVGMRSKLDDLSSQLSTGLRSTTYAGLGSDRSLVVGLGAQLSALSGFQTSNNVLNTQLTLAQSALGQIASVGQKLRSTVALTQYTPGVGGQTMDQATAAAQLDQLVAALNSQAGDRYLFSGRAVDKPATATTDTILNGSGTQAGLKQIISERNQADLGSNGLGRLVIPAAVGSTVSISEQTPATVFGMKLAGVSSSLTGAVVTGPSAPPATISVNLAANPANGDTIKFTFNLPDGTTQDLTLTATTASPPGANQFTIGANPAATATNLQGALTASVTTLASTQLAAASAVEAAHNFFDVDVGQPPQRVSGPPFATATTLVNGTSSNTVTWYTGEMNSDSARDSALARVDTGLSVSYGMRANEQALRATVESTAVFAAMGFSATDPNSSARYTALAQRVGQGLDGSPGSQKITDIEGSLATAQTMIADATTRQKQSQAMVHNMLQGIEGVSNEEVASQILALQTSMQASMQTTALLAKTTLTNYI